MAKKKAAATGHKNTGRIANLTRTGLGRPKGAKNHATLEAKALCSALVDDPEYQRRFRLRFVAGELPPALEAMVWHYGKGKPPETMTHKITFDHAAYLAGEPPDEE